MELISKATSQVNSKNSSIATVAADIPNGSNLSATLSIADDVPSYTKTPKKSSYQIYKKMTEDDWIRLKKQEEMKIEEKSPRVSLVQFDETHSRTTGGQGSRRTSQRSTILKRNSAQSRNEFNQEQDAIYPIRQKCREALENMKLESVLMMLCEEDVKEN